MNNDEITYDDYERTQFSTPSEGSSVWEEDGQLSFEEVASEIENRIDVELDCSILIDICINKPCSSFTSDNTITANNTTASNIPSHNPIRIDISDHKSCNSLDLKAISVGFRKMNMNDRINYVRAMLFSLSAVSCQNEIMKEVTTKTRKKKETLTKLTILKMK